MSQQTAAENAGNSDQEEGVMNAMHIKTPTKPAVLKKIIDELLSIRKYPAKQYGFILEKMVYEEKNRMDLAKQMDAIIKHRGMIPKEYGALISTLIKEEFENIPEDVSDTEK